ASATERLTIRTPSPRQPPMSLEVFSDAWARACAVAINDNPSYRAAAVTWEGSILLHIVASDPGSERRVYLDLWRGECREARSGTATDEDAARYILAGDHAAWHQVLTGVTAPIMAIMMGKLRITKGSLAELLPHVESAKQLVVSAASVRASFPGVA
ncbi:MAG: SCP2 sterol-binding domain-containing protein, partial [Gemmatimonadota bacterium]|nr:SCP2 sterol-binding domain-containing protein [Gemmatimonadota bacterium]